MKVLIDEYSFRLRDDTEAVLHSNKAEQFFKDHNIPYEIETSTEKTLIRYHEDKSVVDLPYVKTVEDVNQYCKKYNLQFVFAYPACKIKFM
jgi:hypothetical protein